MADPVEAPAGSEPVLQASEFPVPSFTELNAAYAASKRKDEEREAELQEPALVAERESSRHAYADMTNEEAEVLLRSTFAETLSRLNAEPARVLSDAKLADNLGHGSAVIESEGRKEILEAGLPIEARNEEEDLEKVDVTLAQGSEGFEPKNPLVDLVIGNSANEGVEVGGEGEAVEISQVGAEKSAGRLLGDKNVFYPEVEEGSDTDLMVSPTSRGVELFDMLRSVESPDTLRFDLALPEGDSVRAAAGGAAEIVDSEGQVVGLVGKPSGEDAQGTYVPVEMQVEGESIVLHTHHREEDLAYPILIDPDIAMHWSGWYGGQNLQGLSYWKWQTNVGWTRSLVGQNGSGPWAGMYGLFQSTVNEELNGGGYSEYYLNTPNTATYLHDVEIWPFWRDDHQSNPECEPWYTEPYDFEGYYDVVQQHWNETDFNDAHNYGKTLHANWGHQYDFGLGVSPGYNVPAVCWRDLMAGGVSFSLGDWAPPNLTSVGTGPSQWISSSASFSVSASATDEGLGVKYLSFTPGGTSTPIEKPTGCQGTYESRCSTSYSGSFSFTGAGFTEGERQVQVSAQDPTLKGSNTRTFTLKVDQKPPEVQLHGQLMAAVNEAGAGEAQGQGGPELSQPVYNLKIDATDGVKGTTEGIKKRSGVKKVEVLLEKAPGEKVKEIYENASCPSSSCDLHPTYALKLTGLSAGVHKLEVQAYDFAGNQFEKPMQIEFEYMPATGISDDFVLQRFPLPDGKNYGEEASHAPELAVNVMNGNVVYHQRDVNVESPDTALEVELFYNSQLPKEQSGEWGRGWTLSQTPRLEKTGGGTGTDTGKALTTEAAIAGGVDLPQQVGQPHFTNRLGAVVTKQSSGGYAVSEESGQEETTTVFNAAGQTTEVQTTPTASVNYSYSAGKLSEIAIDDPASTTAPPPPTKPAPSITPTYVSSFGSSGSGNGQFGHPADVAIDSKGNLWVADENNNRVQEFSADGDFIKTLGSAGTANGQFAMPKSLAFDASGNLWVADAGNNRLEKFNPTTGEFLKAVGTKGSGNGQFSGPEGIAIDPKGNIWVSDTYNYRVQELNAAGEFIKVVSPSGLGAIEPTGLDAAADGNVWVTDWAHNRVVELSEAGALVRQFGSEGTGNGQFQHPDAIVVGTHGELWVGDQSNNRIQEFNTEGQYVTQFGSAGSGAGQFAFSYPLGIATDNQGSLWVADTNNNRVQRWLIPHFGYKPVYVSSFGATGTANGQFKHPGDIAVDPEGNLWVADTENNRLQEFNSTGTFVKVLGSTGSGNGQFSRPKSIAFTPDGNFWVSDSGNNRLQEFNEGGEFIRAVGSAGSGNGQFSGPESLTVDHQGNVWVSDTYNYRVQEFDENGKFIKVVNPSGLGAIEPTGLAVGSGGNVWVSDWAHNRVVEFSAAGALVRQIGSSGSGNGQFSNPDEVAVDARGIVWVGDQSNNRIQGFSESGEYLTQFGSSGAGSGQFAFGYPIGIAADAKGSLWVTDTNHNRIQRWLTGSRVPAEEEKAPVKDDPSVAVATTSGLVSSVTGVQAPTHTYSHEGELLTADRGPEGTTAYKYDVSARLTKVTLPNGTIAEVVYDTTGRATKVTVDPAGAEPAKSTNFSYSEESGTESRKTTVEPEGQRRTFYVTGNDGSVLRWWNAEVPPTFNKESGTLVEKREKELGIGDQTLTIEGHAAEGISTIQFIANGDTIVDERTYTGTRAERENEQLQWIVNTEELSPGTMWIEAVLTDSLENKATKRWWVTVPYIPPPPPGVPQPPRYKRVLEFRENYGLDLDLNPVVNELELHERVIETLGAWHNPQTPLGEVAYAAYERWGVPLRPVDVAELEYREAYIAQDAPLIEAWAHAHAWSQYGGYFADERAGGLIRIGFTEHQAELVAQMKQELGASLAAPSRIVGFSSPPTWTVASIEANAESIQTYAISHPAMQQNVSAVEFVPATNKVRVEAANVSAAEAEVSAAIGSTARVEFKSEPEPWRLASGRYRRSGPVKAGDAMRTITGPEQSGCTAGFGVAERSPGEPTKKYLLTAGHCYHVGEKLWRANSPTASLSTEFSEIGKVARSAYPENLPAGETDALAIQLENLALAPTEIFPSREIRPAAGPAEWDANQHLCFSGVISGHQCGIVTGVVEYTASSPNGSHRSGEMLGIRVNQVEVNLGDSGSPVWNARTGRSVGILSAGKPLGTPHGAIVVAPLKPLPTRKATGTVQHGILAALGWIGEPLSVNPYAE
ncbi:MAG: virginiamycin B lyase family protein [Solirubrobacterales bacterium]